MSLDHNGTFERIGEGGAMVDAQAAFDNAYISTERAFKECGFDQPDDFKPITMIAGVRSAYTPDEAKPPGAIPDLSFTSKAYIGRVVYPKLLAAAEDWQPNALNLAFAIGRLTAAAYEIGYIHSDLPLKINPDRNVEVDGTTLQHKLAGGKVLELGLGVAGLLAHKRNLQAGSYHVTGVNKNRAETEVLKGMRTELGIANRDLRFSSSGMYISTYKLSERAKKEGQPPDIDLIVASRVATAGHELPPSIQQAIPLLEIGGLFIARGPRYVPPRGVSYDTVADILGRHPHLKLIRNKKVDGPNKDKKSRDQRLVVAEKIFDD
jgi:hypothetical protein